MTKCKILVALILTFLTVSVNLPAQQNNQNSDTKKLTTCIQSVSKIDGRYRIDTMVILANQNLQSLINDLDQSILVEKMTVNEIPRFIKSFLVELTDENFSIANRGEEWQVNDVADEELPFRQLIYFGLGKDLVLMVYYTGGIAKSEHILIFKYQKKNITDFWCGNIIKEITSKDEILKYLKENIGKKWGLNTNMIFL